MMKKIILKDEYGNELDVKEGFKKLKEGKSLDIEFNFSKKAKQISNDLLKDTWQSLKSKLRKEGYAVESFQMPQIFAFILAPEDFDVAIKELFYMSLPEKEEYNRIVYPDSLSSAFIKDISGSGKKWLLYICEGRHDINKGLEHELTHIFEDFLNFRSGKLTQRKKRNF